MCFIPQVSNVMPLLACANNSLNCLHWSDTSARVLLCLQMDNFVFPVISSLYNKYFHFKMMRQFLFPVLQTSQEP